MIVFGGLYPPDATDTDTALSVLLGLIPPDETNTEPSARNRLSTSCARPNASTTDLRGSSPMRAVPMMCAVAASPATEEPIAPGAPDSMPSGTVCPLSAPGAAWQIAASLGP